MELYNAVDIANRLVEALTPHCQRVLIAGSIRRSKPEVKDIELVVLPNMIQGTGGDLFNPQPGQVVSADFVRAVKALGPAERGQPTGRYTQIAIVEHSIMLDLFIPDPPDFWRQFAIRTGSAEFAARKIAGGWNAIGWCGSDVGLRKIEDCEYKSGKWKCINPKAELPPVWNSEEEFFAWLQIPWIHPKARIA